VSGWYHAPPPGARSGVADYAETLRRALDPLGNPGTNLYHLGNNGLHARIYDAALAKPGVVVLHDGVLHHFLLGHLTRERYIDEFVYNYGEWRRQLAEDLWDERGASGADPRYFEFAMLRRIVEVSRAVIVHNPGAASLARAHGARQVHLVPHFLEPSHPPDAADSLRFRERIGVEPGDVLFGIFGFLRETKRILPSIRAFLRLHAVHPRTALLLAGECVSPGFARLLAAESTHPAIRRIGYLSESDFPAAADSVDCCINLRYPGAGETSGIAMRMMGLGKPVILTASEENSALPDVACLRVHPGVAESEELFHHMVMVAEFPRIARDIGDCARRHAREHHALDSVTRQYWRILCAAS